MNCSQCGAPLRGDPKTSRTCAFCQTINAPAPTKVEVAVPVQIVHNVVQVAAGDASTPKERRCPHCKKRLVSVVAQEIELHGCGGCGGIWIENSSAWKVLSNPSPIFSDLAKRAANNARDRHTPRPNRPTCAECPAVLDKVRSNGIELDVCQEHGTWFDAWELQMLTDTLLGKTAAKAVRDDKVLPCAGCRQEYKASSLNVTEWGLRCESCWRKQQGELQIEAVQKTQSASAAVAVGIAGAMILGAFVGGASRSS